jgi:hypothetical protein
MRLVWYLLLLMLLPTLLWAQNGVVNGKVMSADLQQPLGKASVFLSNATFGTATNNDGTFTLRDVKPGQYELVITYVGYETYTQTILVGAKPLDLNIEMHLKSTKIDEVTVVSHKFNKENFARFVREFIGTSENARQCKVINPKVVDLYYSKLKMTLEGHTDEFLIIDNKALGYRVKFLLNEFKVDDISNIISWEGRVLYEELKGSKGQLAKWHKKREEAYYGSSMHFFRSLYKQQLTQEGFVIRRLIRKPNPERPPQPVIKQKLDRFDKLGITDSINRWRTLSNLPRYNEFLVKDPLSPQDVVRTTDEPGVFGLVFQDYLYVVYTKKRDEDHYSGVYRSLDMENYLTSIVTLYTKYALFDMNGVIISPRSTLFEGAWSNDKIAELLPVDYAPEVKK